MERKVQITPEGIERAVQALKRKYDTTYDIDEYVAKSIVDEVLKALDLDSYCEPLKG